MEAFEIMKHSEVEGRVKSWTHLVVKSAEDQDGSSPGCVGMTGWVGACHVRRVQLDKRQPGPGRHLDIPLPGRQRVEEQHT